MKAFLMEVGDGSTFILEEVEEEKNVGLTFKYYKIILQIYILQILQDYTWYKKTPQMYDILNRSLAGLFLINIYTPREWQDAIPVQSGLR